MERDKVKHLVGMLRISFDSNANVINRMETSSNFTEGMKAGMEIANDSFRSYIERLENLLAEGYMQEDVDLSGSEKIGEVI